MNLNSTHNAKKTEIFPQSSDTTEKTNNKYGSSAYHNNQRYIQHQIEGVVHAFGTTFGVFLKIGPASDTNYGTTNQLNYYSLNNVKNLGLKIKIHDVTQA